MTTKLTLTIEDSVINSAKEYARSNGKSLSGIVENYLRSVTATNKKTEKHLPQVAKLMGVINLPEDFDYKIEMGNAVSRKYNK